MKPGRYRLPSVILSRTNFGEADLIINFLTQEWGKIGGLAKHGRKSLKRFGNVLSPGQLVELDLVCRPGRELVQLQAGELIRSFDGLGRHIRRLAMANLTVELTDAFCAPLDVNPELFSLLTWSLERLDEDQRPEEALFIFMVRLLHQTGFGPNVNECQVCGEPPLESRSREYKIVGGGLACPACLSGGGALSLGSIRTIALTQSLPLSKLERLRVGPQARAESQPVLLTYARQILGRDIKSLKFLEQLDRQAAWPGH